MSEPPRQPPPAKKAAGPWTGVAGCGITFALTILGAATGGWIGWITSPPAPPRTHDYSGLREMFDTIAHLAIGLVVGGLAGLTAGIVITVLLFRRNKLRPANDATHRAGNPNP